MTKEDLLAQISELKDALDLITLNPSAHVPDTDALQEFQAVVGTTRRSVWTVLKAMKTEDYQEYVASFRLRRGSGELKAVMDDIEAGFQPSSESMDVLRDTLVSVVSTRPSGS